MRLNRTLSEMRANVQIWMNDSVSATFATSDIDAKLQSALETLCNMLSADNRGQRCLRKTSSQIAIVANQRDYAIPTDCLRIDKIECSDLNSTPAEWYSIPFGAPEIASGTCSGSALAFAVAHSNHGFTSWSDNADTAGYVRLNPTPAQALYKIRFVYYFMPDFPEAVPSSYTSWTKGTTPATAYAVSAIVANDGNYYRCIFSHSAADANEPGIGANWETCWERIKLSFEDVPMGFDTLCEYYACALLAHEELEDGKPIGAFGSMFAQKYREMINGPAGGVVRPQRRYVITGSSR